MVHSSSSAAVADDAHDTEVALPQPSEGDGRKLHRPEAFSDLLRADSLPFEEVPHEDLLVLPPDGLVLGNDADLEMRRVVIVLGSSGDGPIRGPMDRGGSFKV